MSIRLHDRVAQKTTSKGTGTLAFGAAVATYFTFAQAETFGLADGDYVTYLVKHDSADEFEEGWARYSSGVGLVRSDYSIVASSNGGQRVNFSAGTKTMSIVLLAVLAIEEARTLLGSIARIAAGATPWYAVCGNGSDGELSASSGTVTLTSNKQYRRVSLSGTAKINTNGYYVRSWETDLSSAGADAIHNNATTTTAGGQATIGGADSAAGKSGGTTPAGSGTNGATVGGIGGTGGDGGKGGGAGAAGTGGTVSGSFTPTTIADWLTSTGAIQAAFAALEGGAPGGGGGGGSTPVGGPPNGTGGASGAGGGQVLWVTGILTVGAGTAAGAIAARGGNGTDGEASAGSGDDSGGGGGGGGGGAVSIAYVWKDGSKTGAISCAGGTGGNAGNDVNDGDGGDGGKGGVAFVLDLTTGTLTTTNGSAGSANSGLTGGAGGACSANL